MCEFDIWFFASVYRLGEIRVRMALRGWNQLLWEKGGGAERRGCDRGMVYYRIFFLSVCGRQNICSLWLPSCMTSGHSSKTLLCNLLTWVTVFQVKLSMSWCYEPVAKSFTIYHHMFCSSTHIHSWLWDYCNFVQYIVHMHTHTHKESSMFSSWGKYCSTFGLTHPYGAHVTLLLSAAISQKWTFSHTHHISHITQLHKGLL